MRSGFLLVLLSNVILVRAQDKEVLFLHTYTEVITAFANADSSVLQQYIHPTHGIYYLERTGVYDRVFSDHTIDHYCRGEQQWKAYKGISTAGLTYGKLPVFRCEDERWTKTGSYADTTLADHILINTAYSLIKYAGERFTTREYNHLAYIDSVSRRIVVARNNAQALVFYLGYIDNKWWITIIDCVTDDCSA